MPTEPPAADRTLLAVLTEARARGFLGPGPLEQHLANAAAFAAAAPHAPAHALDLGSGGGVPGLILAVRWPSTHWLLLDVMHRRCELLHEAIGLLGLSERVEVVEARAEAAGRDAGLRGRLDLVTARGFARPAITAECGAPLLADGGLLLVSEPPEGASRWDAAGLREIGLRDDGVVAAPGGHIRTLRRTGPIPDRYPRRVGIPAKRPLW